MKDHFERRKRNIKDCQTFILCKEWMYLVIINEIFHWIFLEGGPRYHFQRLDPLKILPWYEVCETVCFTMAGAAHNHLWRTYSLREEIFSTPME